LLERLRAPAAPDGRFDCDWLPRDAGRERELDEPDGVPERGLALAPLVLAPLRPDVEPRLAVPFRLLVRPPDADRLARDCGFLLAIVCLPSLWRVRTGTRSACPKTRCKPAVTRERPARLPFQLAFIALVLAAMRDDDS
jgi:hypothetical protein